LEFRRPLGIVTLHMTTHTLRSLATGVLCVFAPSIALAGPGATLINDGRSFDLSASGDSDFSGDSAQIVYFPDSEFADFGAGDSLQAFGAQSAIATTQGNMFSTLSSTLFTYEGTIGGTATIFDETGYNASSSGRARMQIGFSLAQASTWRLIADLFSETGAIAEVIVSQGVNEGGPLIGSWSSLSVSAIDEQIVLGPGEYTVIMETRYAITTFGPATLSTMSTLDASFALVPAPGAGSLLAIGAMAGARRRRRI
jgi:hypothetical protein